MAWGQVAVVVTSDQQDRLAQHVGIPWGFLKCSVEGTWSGLTRSFCWSALGVTGNQPRLMTSFSFNLPFYLPVLGEHPCHRCSHICVCGCSSGMSSTLLLETGSLVGSVLADSARLAGQEALQITSASLVQMPAIILGYSMWILDLTLRSSSMGSKPSPWLDSNVFFEDLQRSRGCQRGILDTGTLHKA